MRFIIFLLIEFIACYFVVNYFKIILFYHFSKKIRFSMKNILIKPHIKNKKLNFFIRDNNFKLLGLRKETIFKFFSYKYFLYKNNKNVFLDIHKSQKYSYFSFSDNGKVKMFFSKNLNIKNLIGEGFSISNYKKLSDLNFQVYEEITREEIFDKYYNDVNFVSRVNLISSYFVVVVFIIQFIYLLIKWF